MGMFDRRSPVDEALDQLEDDESLEGAHCSCGRKLTGENVLRRFIGMADDGLPAVELWCLPCVLAGEMGLPGDPNG